MKNSEYYDVFISYRRRHSLKVESIYTELIKEYKVFFDQSSLRTGVEYEKMIYSAIKNSKCFIVVLTKESCKEFNEKKNSHEVDWVENELSYAYQNNIPILPIVLYDEKYYNDVEIMINSLEKCVPKKIKSFLPKLQLFKIRLEYRTRISDIDTLKQEINVYTFKQGIIENINTDNISENRKNKRKPIKKFFLLVFILLIFGLGAWVTFLFIKKPKISIEDTRLEKRVFISKKNIEKIISNPFYIKYKTEKHGNFDFRSIYYHEKTILPKNYEAKIKNEIENYILFLNKKIEDIESNMSNLQKLDNVETYTLFTELFWENEFLEDLSIQEAKLKIKEHLEKNILKIKKIIKYLQNNSMIKNKTLLELKVLNTDNSDKLVKNSIKIAYKNKIYVLYRTKRPISHKELLAVPVSNGNTAQESFEQKDFKVIPRGSIVELWYTFKKEVKLCSAGGNYKIILYNKANESISKIIKCKGVKQ